MVVLEKSALVEFFLQLPDGVCGEIHEFLKKGDHRADIGNAYSAWHEINHNYEKRFDPDKHLESCRKYLAKNWRYGLPLVDDAVNQGDYQLAESFLIKTFSSYLGASGKKKWDPEGSLLLIEARTAFREGDEEITSLLKTWADVAKQLRDQGRSAAAHFQAVTFHDPEKWDLVLKEYQHLSKGATEAKLAPLFSQWKNEMAARSYPYFLDSGKVIDTWIHWLITALLDMKQDKGRFLNKIHDWL